MNHNINNRKYGCKFLVILKRTEENRLITIKIVLAHCSEWFREIGNLLLVLLLGSLRAFIIIITAPVRWPIQSARKSLIAIGVLERKWHQSYPEFLQSEYWKKFRSETIEYYQSECFICGLDYQAEHLPIQVHHFKYKKWGFWIMGMENKILDVCLLCKKHHIKGEVSRFLLFLTRREYKHYKLHGCTSYAWRLLKFFAKWELI